MTDAKEPPVVEEQTTDPTPIKVDPSKILEDLTEKARVKAKKEVVFETPKPENPQNVQPFDVGCRVAVSILTVLAVTLVVAALSKWVFASVLASILPAWPILTNGLPTALGITAGALTLCWLLAERSITVDAVKGVVTESLLHDKMWSFLQGFYLLYPWEKVFRVVDLSREVRMGEDADESYLSKNDQPLKVKFLLIRRVNKYLLLNYVKNDENAADPVFKARIKSFLAMAIRLMDDGDVINSLEDYKEAFVNVFGGPNYIDPLEEQYGYSTDNPVLYNIERIGPGAESRAKVVETESFMAAVKLHFDMMHKADPTYTMKQAKDDIMQITGDARRVIFTLDGIDLAQLPQGLESLTLSVGGMAPGGGVAQQPKKKK